MEKFFIIIAYNGVEIIDSSPEAEIRISSMDYLEERAIREKKQKMRYTRKIAESVWHRFPCIRSIILSDRKM